MDARARARPRSRGAIRLAETIRVVDEHSWPAFRWKAPFPPAVTSMRFAKERNAINLSIDHCELTFPAESSGGLVGSLIVT